MAKPTSGQWELVAREWREAGNHLKNYGETLIHAFQSGWDADRADARLGQITDELRATTRRFEAALRAAREAAEAEGVRQQLAEARGTSARAAAETQDMLAAALSTFAEALGQLAGKVQRWRGKRAA
jgi:ABC-type transporter Mla subunit MlaD